MFLFCFRHVFFKFYLKHVFNAIYLLMNVFNIYDDTQDCFDVHLKSSLWELRVADLVA